MDGLQREHQRNWSASGLAERSIDVVGVSRFRERNVLHGGDEFKRALADVNQKLNLGRLGFLWNLEFGTWNFSPFSSLIA
jgi:hypothetical protein